MNISSEEKILVECKKIGGWCKIVKGKLSFPALLGPCRLLVKYNWKGKFTTMAECRIGEVIFFEEPLILTEGIYFKLERF